MNKLTDEARREWGKNLILLQSSCGNTEMSVDSDDLCALIESEKAGWEEVERMKEENERLNNEMDGLLTVVEDKNISAHDVFISLKQSNVKLQEEVEQMKQLYKNYLDMYTTTVSEKNMLKGQLQDALDMLVRIEGIARGSMNAKHRPANTEELIFKIAQAAIQRIQEEGKNGGK